MSEIESLVKEYERYVRLPWDRKLAGPQKVWFALYDPSQEHRLRPRIGEFQAATHAAGHGWLPVDITNAFADWMANHEYREAYFERPEDMGLALADFGDAVAEQVREVLRRPEADSETVVAVIGLASLFGLAKVSELIARVAPDIGGRLLAFFPGQRDGARWRLLGVGDGWNYHAVPISGGSEGE